MTNTIDITQFREGNRYEAKLAKRGLPNSIWETYSALQIPMAGLFFLELRKIRTTRLP